MKKAVIIGAGPGGLTTAVKLAKEGLDVTLLESHNKVGGLAQSWQRKPMLSNGDQVVAQFELTHAISGFHEGGTHYNLYKNMGVDMDRMGPFTAAPKFAALRAPGKNKLEILNDFSSNKQYLLHTFPHEAKGIERFFSILDNIDQERQTSTRRDGWQKAIEEFIEPRIDNPYLKVPFYLLTKPTLVMRRNHTFQRYLDDCFKTPEIKALLSTLYGYVGLPSSKVSGTLMNAMLLSYWQDGGPQAPEFSSYQALHNELARTLTEKYNGKLLLKTKATEIIAEEGKAKGVIAECSGNKTSMEADCVVVAGDMKKAMLPLKEHLPKSYFNRLEQMAMSLSLMNVHAIVEKDLMKMSDELGYAANVLVSSYDDIEKSNGTNFPDRFGIYVSAPTVLRPKAKLITDTDGNPIDKYHIIDIVMQSPPYEFWNNLRTNDVKEYREMKRKYAEQMIGITDRMLIPGLKDSIRFVDGYTATTHEKFCGCTEGAVYTFEPTPKQFIPNRFSPKTPIDGLYLTGSTVMSAGVAGAINGAVLTADLILKKNK